MPGDTSATPIRTTVTLSAPNRARNRAEPARPEIAGSAARDRLRAAERALLDEHRLLSVEELTTLAELPDPWVTSLASLAHQVRLDWCGPAVEVVLPGVKALKAEYLGITGNTVADWMKDLQIDATALPGKAFDLSFEMPEPDVGIMTFNRCVAADQWETMGRPDILEKNCHSTCPKSMIKTTEMYNPNMKVDILAIPPRKDPGDVCCKWRFSMRSEDEPEYVPVTLNPTRKGDGPAADGI